MSRYGWSLWGYIQAATSDQDFDFHGWGQERYEAAVEDFRSPAFGRLLDTAGGVQAMSATCRPAPASSSSAVASSARASPTT